MSLPLTFLDPSHWQVLPVDVLFAVYPGESLVDRMADGNLPFFEPETVYQPASRVPDFVLCRTSDSEKRLENKLESREVLAAPWGTLNEVLGNGSVVGVVVAINGANFCGAHALPDGVHLLSCAEGLPATAIVQDVFESKVVKIFSVGVPTEKLQDIVITAKARWFRNRINPKFLGFSKDEKV